MTGKQEGPYKGEETKVEEDKVWHYHYEIKKFLKYQFDTIIGTPRNSYE